MFATGDHDWLVRLSIVAIYAAYGSNMDHAQMARRCPHSPQEGTGWLEGWRLTFGGEDIGWEGALATVVEDEGNRVFVVLYEVSEADEQALDRWDGATASRRCESARWTAMSLPGCTCWTTTKAACRQPAT